MTDLEKFRAALDEQTVEISLLKPRLINEILLQCIKISSIDPVPAPPSPPPPPTISEPFEIDLTVRTSFGPRSSSPKSNNLTDGTEFIETFMHKLHPFKCFFLFSDDTCKSVVKLFVAQNRQFSAHSLNFLLRCHDLELIRQVFELNLINEKCSGDCHDW